MSQESTYYNISPTKTIALHGFSDAGSVVRSRAEKIKRVYLINNGETLLERMKIEVPRRINWQSSGGSHVPALVAYYKSFGSDPVKVAEAWRSEFPDLFPGGINARYDSAGNVVSTGGSSTGGSGSTGSVSNGGSGSTGTVTTGGAAGQATIFGMNPWVVGGIGVGGVVLLSMLRK